MGPHPSPTFSRVQPLTRRFGQRRVRVGRDQSDVNMRNYGYRLVILCNQDESLIKECTP